MVTRLSDRESKRSLSHNPVSYLGVDRWMLRGAGEGRDRVVVSILESTSMGESRADVDVMKKEADLAGKRGRSRMMM